MRVLSTKKLTLSQKELFLNANISFVEYDSIHFAYKILQNFEASHNIIATSKNAIISLIKNHFLNELKSKNWFCVGEKTSRFLQENDIKVLQKGKNALDLAEKIIKQNQKEAFTYFAGNLKREELATQLKKENITLNIIEVYQTSFNEKQISGDFDGIMFFSPSGIKSYVKKNQLNKKTAFCIGETTANEARKHTDHIIVANKPTVENTIVQVVKYFNQI